jgi:hypothetical protein
MWAGTLLQADNEYPCVVLDISELGAKVEATKIPKRPSLVKLLCPQFGTLEGWLLWSRKGKAGIRFHLPPADVFEKLRSIVPGLGRKDPAHLSADTSAVKRFGFGRLPRAESQNETPGGK